MAAVRAELCAVGDFAWDVVIRTDDPLQLGGDTFGEVSLHPGGSAANTAVWAARCGALSHFVGKIGTDRLALWAHEDLASEGVVDHMVETPSHPTGTVAAFVDHQGRRSMVSGHGADHYLEPDDLPEDLLRTTPHLHLTAWSLFNDPPRTAALKAAELARAGGGTLSFDPSSFQLIEKTGVAEFLALSTALRPDVVFPNRDEGATLTGEHEPTAMAGRLAELYPEATIVVKLDAEGALLSADGTSTTIGATPTRVVDSTGAGDAFAGAYLSAHLSGASPLDSAQFACAVAEWVVGRSGARPTPDAELGDIVGPA